MLVVWLFKMGIACPTATVIKRTGNRRMSVAQ